MKVYWMDGSSNYGDILTPHILKWAGVPFVKAGHDNQDAIMVGSIAKFARGDVFGSGFIRHADPVNPKARYHWVRGPMTRDKILAAGGKCPELYGDAAFLLPKMWPASEKKHALGIVPHHVDYEIARKLFPDVPVINLETKDPKATTAQITECERVICSSLHGLIVAHAYGIPAAWVKFSDNLHGDGFKFHDYFASIGKGAILSTYDSPVYTLGSLDADFMLEVLACFR